MPPSKRAKAAKAAVDTSPPNGGAAHVAKTRGAARQVKRERESSDTHDATSSQHGDAGGDPVVDARRERQLQINRQAQHRHREKRKAREGEYEGRIKELTTELAQMSVLKDELEFLKGHLQLEQRQVAVLKHEIEFKNTQLATLKTNAAAPAQAEPAAKRIKRKLSKTISDATPDEWLQLVQAAQAADPQVRIETLAAYASLCDQMNTALHAYQTEETDAAAPLPAECPLVALLAASRSLINKMSMLSAEGEATDGEERWVRSMWGMKLSDAQGKQLLALRQQAVEELSTLYKFREVVAKHGMQISESLGVFVKGVSGTGIMPQVWQSHGMMSSLLEDMTTNLTEEETVFKNFHNEAWAMLSPLQRAIFITESAPCYPDILAMVNSLALLSQHAAAELAEREAEHASDDE